MTDTAAAPTSSPAAAALDRPAELADGDEVSVPGTREGRRPGARARVFGGAVVGHRRHRLTASLVLLVALVARLSFVVDHPRGALAYDEVLYDGLAANVLDGRGFSLEGVEVGVPAPYRDGPTAIMAPGYPALLIGVYRLAGHDPTVVRLLQALLGAVGCLLVYVLVRAWRPLARPSSASYCAALAAGLMAAVSRVLVDWANLVLSENLAVPLVLLALLLAKRPPSRWRGANLVALATTLGLALHVRGELAFVAAVVVLWMALAPRGVARPGRTPAWRRRDAAWLTLALGLSLAPWALRNLRSLGGPVFVRSFSGPVMYYANNELLRSTWAMALGETAALPAGAEDLPPGDELALDRFLRTTAISFVRAHPDRFIQAAALKSALFWRPIGEPWRSPGGWANRVLPGAAAFWLALAGALASWRRRRWSLALLALLAAEAAFVAGFGAWERERFRTPLYALELMFTGVGLVWAFAFLRRAVEHVISGTALAIPARHAAAAGGVGAAALVLAWQASRCEPIVAHAGFDRPEALASWQRLQGTDLTVSVDEQVGARGPGSLRLRTQPDAGWQDIQLHLASRRLKPSHLYRVSFDGRAHGGAGGQVYPLVPAVGPDGGSVGLVRYEFGEGDWRSHSLYFTAPFDADDPVAVYVSHADYSVSDAITWIDDLTVFESSWWRFLWDGYVRAAW